ncbi:FecR domain-containing protein [Sandaracinus amylolyticus]|uniref:Putative iron siderophore sensor protein n=1 Tax=Sandaracinus amylolyticus TaxID=927083 RepID=A0A0F6W141_9BACT|nr:FecR domain-containing protein [Sandaracinus amylolyticus]AKF04590.1 putative iron siderophore sensor protein [Sandaracinus amylolyticus]
MSVELEQARRAEPDWDELRERRVLARVLAARGEGAARRRRARVAVAFGAGVAVAAAALLVWMRPATTQPSSGGAVATVAVEGEAGTSRPARLSLRDGSEVFLAASADVRVESESEGAVRIAQLAGEARYVVSHRPERSFVVVVEAVEVRVRGTQFVVRRGELEVEVEVEEGRVEVARGDDASMLGAGDALRVRMRADEPTPEPEIVPEPEIAPSEPEPETSSAERSPRPSRRESIEELTAQADEARRAGRLDDAARALRAATIAEPRDPRVATAFFTLGRVERARARDVAAAEAFEAAFARAPHGALAEDALAEAAVSWSAAGRRERARASARRYLELHPSGLYAERVRHLAE